MNTQRTATSAAPDALATVVRRHPDAWKGRARPAPPRSIVLHHTVTFSLEDTMRVLRARGLSTHYVVEPDGTIWETCDPTRVAAHAGPWNEASIGIDIVNPLVHKHWRKAKKLGWPEVRTAKWAARSWTLGGLGRRLYIADTEPAIARTWALVAALCERFAIPLVLPEPGERLVLDPAAHRGVVAHGTVNRKRWDGFAVLEGGEMS
jgi:hypothetical protein